MPAYDAEAFDPPAPVARAVVRGPTGRTRDNVLLLIDTGSDGSLIPRRAVEEVGAEIQQDQMAVELYDGTVAAADVAEVGVELLGRIFRGPFGVADAEYGVLGRNVLNLLVLALDGPRQNWSI